ncbi:MAG: lycopene cyclase family protein [Bacteriovoracaceae bacterium]
MDSRPIIIIGAGIWGSLLGLRLKKCHPEIPFEIHEPTSSIGDGIAWAFAEDAIIAGALHWLAPLISSSWKSYETHFHKYQKKIQKNYHVVTQSDLEIMIKDELRENLFLNSCITTEEALTRGAFVFDTRNEGYYFKQSYFKKTVGFSVDLNQSSQYFFPVMADISVQQRDQFRYLKILPVNSRTLYVKDIRKSLNDKIEIENVKNDVIDFLELKNLGIKSISIQETHVQVLPICKSSFLEFPRVINLTDISHDVTGECISDAVRLIDQIMKTSMRFGEVRSIVEGYREKKMKVRNYYHFINNLIFKLNPHRSYEFHQYLYQLPHPLIEKFHSGELSLKDIIESLMRKPLLFPVLLSKI